MDSKILWVVDKLSAYPLVTKPYQSLQELEGTLVLVKDHYEINKNG